MFSFKIIFVNQDYCKSYMQAANTMPRYLSCNGTHNSAKSEDTHLPLLKISFILVKALPKALSKKYNTQRVAISE